MPALTDDFNTELGVIRTWIEPVNNNLPNGNNSLTFSTASHTITLEVFELKNEWLTDGMRFETSRGWRWHVKKINALKENLTIYCKLINPATGIEWSPNSGEHLDAIEIENKTFHLHIGTEDGEIMQSRARNSDEMPLRFLGELDLGNSFTHYDGFGFKTVVPTLEENETIYFHFLIATNTIKQSVQYPEERDTSTWYAVEQSKEFLDNYLKVK